MQNFKKEDIFSSPSYLLKYPPGSDLVITSATEHQELLLAARIWWSGQPRGCLLTMGEGVVYGLVICCRKEVDRAHAKPCKPEGNFHECQTNSHGGSLLEVKLG